MIGKIVVVLTLVMSSFASNGKTLNVDFTLPNFNVANYRSPYVAIWVESKQSKETFSLWHMIKSDKDKWLVDIRRWWRKLGRYGDVSDGVTGATRGPGKYHHSFDLPDVNEFTFFIEVVRENGGRSLLKKKINLNDLKSVYEFDADKEIGPVIITIGKE